MSEHIPITQYVPRPGILDLGWGHPAAENLPVESWTVAASVTLARYGARALGYGNEPGPGPLIEWLTDHLGHVDAAAPTTAETFVTAGASHGLDLVTSMLTRPGDVVVVDSPTYHLALRLIADHGVTLVPAPSDAHGLDPDGLDEILTRVPMLYLVPTFANPTGLTLPVARRQALIEVAQRHGTTIVEDDTYRELHYGWPAPASLWSLAERGTVIRIGSFAKTVAPGLRLGWLNARADTVTALIRRGYVDSGGGVNHTAALTMATFAASSEYERHLSRIRLAYRARRDALAGELAAQGVPVRSPDGGWFLWLTLPSGVDAVERLPVAEAAGVSYLPGPLFYTGPGGADHVRLSFSMLDPHELRTAARRLGPIFREPP